tara:strand:- start:432 stop:1604 length:1173 start_codon:yes stop_codon:yes gene_type:complete
MATTFKTLRSKDVVSTRTMLHEAIPMTGTIVSGTYNDLNIKNYSHGIFQSVFDYPYLSSSANHIFDITFGFASGSQLSGSGFLNNAKKQNIYNELAQVLVGFDETGSVRQFDEDGDLTGGTKIKEAFFLNFTRLLQKDEIKKGSFTLELGVGAAPASVPGADPFGSRVTLQDISGATQYKVNSPAGEYGILYANNSVGTQLKNADTTTQTKAGLIFYQAGIAVVTASIFSGSYDTTSSTGESGYNNSGLGLLTQSISGTQLSPNGTGPALPMVSGNNGITASLSASAISGTCDVLRHRIYNIQFNNTTELNSTIYFCRANHNEFNYSSNPTYLSASKLVVKNNSQDTPVSYATSVGLYSPDNELLAVAKLSEPMKKDPSNEFTVRVRLDY